MNISFNKRGESLLKVECDDLTSWKDGDRLVRYLKQTFEARIDDYAEGPDARRWFISIDKHRLAVDQTDLGDLALSALDADGEIALHRAAEHLQAVSLVELTNKTRTLRERVFGLLTPRS
jgi:hypothetical protein